jgi:SP family sugar:H+ symporter-like MFS transporter
MSSVIRGTSTIPTDLSWRIPVALFYVVPSIVASAVWFLPESPRWLLSKGRTDDARTALLRIRVNATEESVNEEIEHVMKAIAIESTQGSYADMFKGTNTRRTLIVMGVNFFLQATGQGESRRGRMSFAGATDSLAFGSNYGAIYIRSLGTINPFNMTLINSFIGFFGCIVAMILVDKTGRRKLMIFGTIGQTACLLVMGGVGSE